MSTKNGHLYRISIIVEGSGGKQKNKYYITIEGNVLHASKLLRNMVELKQQVYIEFVNLKAYNVNLFI